MSLVLRLYQSNVTDSLSRKRVASRPRSRVVTFSHVRLEETGPGVPKVGCVELLPTNQPEESDSMVARKAFWPTCCFPIGPQDPLIFRTGSAGFETSVTDPWSC